MTLRLIGSLILLFAAGSLGAQDPATGKPATGTPATGNPAAGTNGGDAGAGRQCDRDAERINRRAQQMREQLGTGKAIKSHVKVQVRLNNGNRLEGVVKDGRLVEKVTGLRFEDQGFVLEMGEIGLHGPASELAEDPRVIDTYLGAARDKT